MFNFAITNRVQTPEGVPPEDVREPGGGTPPQPLPESPQPSPESPIEPAPGTGPSPGSGRGGRSDTRTAGQTTATPVAPGSFARPGMAPQMAAFNTLAPVSKLSRGGPGSAPIAGSNTFDQSSSPVNILDELLRRLGLVQ